MAAVEVALRTVLALVFGAAFISKARSRRAFSEFADSLRDIGWLRGRWRPSAAAVAIPLLEAGTVVLLAEPRTVPWGFGAGSILLAAFTTAVGREVARGHRVRCRCFGAGHSQIGPSQIARNLVLFALSAAGLALSPVSHGRASATGMVLSVGVAALAALALVRWDDLSYVVQAR